MLLNFKIPKDPPLSVSRGDEILTPRLTAKFHAEILTQNSTPVAQNLKPKKFHRGDLEFY
ncbi:MAG: hypothetical protein ACLVCW_03255 [Campylobacter sp.]